MASLVLSDSFSLLQEEPSVHPLLKASPAFFLPWITVIDPTSPRRTAPKLMPKDSVYSQEYPRKNELPGVLTAVGSRGRVWGLALWLKLVPGCLDPKHSPHVSLALILGQGTQRVSACLLRYLRFNSIELPSEKVVLFSNSFQFFWFTQREKSEFGARRSSKPF